MGRTAASTTQIGKVGETLVAAQLMLTSKGRLSPFLPLADDGGIDLLVYDKHTQRALPVQVKGRVIKGEMGSRPVQFDVRRATFTAHPDAFLLAVLLDVPQATIARAWLIPTTDLEQISQRDPALFSITPSPSTDSKDRYAPYRCTTMAEVTRRLLVHVDGNAGGAA